MVPVRNPVPNLDQTGTEPEMRTYPVTTRTTIIAEAKIPDWITKISSEVGRLSCTMRRVSPMAPILHKRVRQRIMDALQEPLLSSYVGRVCPLNVIDSMDLSSIATIPAGRGTYAKGVA